jgi:ketosteroid isomerase-like protein
VSRTTTAEADVRAAELERCRAISERDWDALDRLLAEDLTHTHMHGRVDDKRALVENLRLRPRTVRRGELKIRLYGDIAIMNGRQYLDLGDGETEIEAIQVWQRADDNWRLLAFQASPAAPPAVE